MASKSRRAAASVSITDADGTIVDFADDPALQSTAMKWSYIVRNRRRWEQEAHLEDVTVRARGALEALGVTGEQLQRMARAGTLEVVCRFKTESEGWAGRVMPWEFMLSGATREQRWRENRRLVVLRHLVRPDGPASRDGPWTGLVVISNPKEVEAEWDFGGERDLVSRVLRDAGAQSVEVLMTPTIAKIEAAVEEHQPNVIHVAGADIHQGVERLGLSTDALGVREPKLEAQRRHWRRHRVGDGMLVTDAEGETKAATYEEVARALNAGAAAPELVFFNLFNSAARMAALTVAGGARAAIGFQDVVDNRFAERFIEQFFGSWGEFDHREDDAFDFAWQRARIKGEQYTGTGVVLWSDRSHVVGAEDRRKAQAQTWESLDARRRLDHKYDQADAKKFLEFDIEPFDKLNYALLHNREPMFSRFSIRHKQSGTAQGIRVEVTLNVGAEQVPFSGVYDVPSPSKDLAGKIFLPLTSRLFRSLTESIQSSLCVRVSLAHEEDAPLFEQPWRVRLLPVNEWADTDRSRHWLSSFVYPMDSAVARIINEAQPFLEAIADDREAGFDGYQSAADIPDRPDHQVAAIWSALIDRTPLRYINPPPTYTISSQRLRTPSSILGAGRGTCIDLTLLLAACYEHIGLYPTIFLMKGHAFPGYWRDEESWNEFQGMSNLDEMDEDELETLVGTADSFGQKRSWIVDGTRYQELLQQIEEGALVPLESVWLTMRSSFQEAQDEGWENILAESEFDCMIDVMGSRWAREPVTPLPLDQADAVRVVDRIEFHEV